MSIKHPRWAMGGHGDLADAFTLAIWQVCGQPLAAPDPEQGTKEWEAVDREKRQRRMQERADRPFWKKAG